MQYLANKDIKAIIRTSILLEILKF